MARNFEVSWNDETGKASASFVDGEGSQSVELTYKLTTNQTEDGEQREVEVTSINGCSDLRTWIGQPAHKCYHRYCADELKEILPGVIDDIVLIIETKDHGVIC